MEDYQYEMINLFNKNFKSNDVKNILKIYKKDISLIEYFKDINLKEEKFQHPLFINYNYCLLCGERRKTKYYSQNIISSHMELEDKNLGQYLLNNNIKIRQIKNKREKITKRRFIHSYKNSNSKNSLDNLAYCDTDTELYIYKKKQIKNCKTKITNMKNNLKTNFDEIQKLKKSLIDKDYKETTNKKNLKQFKNIYDDIDNYNDISPKKSSLISKSSERKINLDNSINIKKGINIDEEEIKTDINNENDFSANKNNFIIDIKQNDEFISKKFKQIKNRNNKSQPNLLETSSFNSEFKLGNITINKNENDKNINKNNEIITLEKREKDRVLNENNKLFNVINETKKFFGFGKKNTTDLKGRTLSNNYDEHDKNFFRKSSYKDKMKQKKINFLEKNDNCSICLQEIKEKFTLICGDFFCRDCIRDTIITAIKEISNLDQLHCPTCKERIEENTIKKLLTDKEFQTYQNLITKIEGLKNHHYIPCPYPDCPGWKDDTTNSHINIVYCQYEHTFCKKCLEIVDKSYRRNHSEHKCYSGITEEEEETMQFFKENKNFRKCPNCQSMVVKEGVVCNNMTCTNVWCGYEFCWICNRKYDDSHYKNPLSMCFGLQQMNSEGKLAKYKRVRFFRCIFIFLLIIFVILPVIILFFSLFEVCLFIITFVLDGSFMKNIKLKPLIMHKFFYKIVYSFFIMIGIAYIPIGYISLVVFSFALPVICILHKLQIKNDEDLD